MAWHRRFTTMAFVAIVAAIAVYAAKTYRKAAPDAPCRFAFQCALVDGEVVECVEGSCAAE